MKPKHWLLLIVVAFLICLLFGWLRQHDVVIVTQGDRLEVTLPWTAWALSLSLGVWVVAAAVVLLGWIARGKARRPALMLLVAGLVWTAAAATSGPFDWVSADPHAFQYRSGVFGAYTRRVALDDVERIEVYKARRRGRKSRNRMITMTRFHHADGEIDLINFGAGYGPKWPVLEHILTQARQRGVEVNDHRDAKPN